MSGLPELRVLGIGGWASGLPSWSAMAAHARGEADADPDAPRRPSPDLLPANERRRAPDSVLLALQVAQAACADAGCDPRELPSVFASMHGDLAITDYMCSTLRDAPQELSPTKFHNSVHNAAAGYWTIGTGCHRPATALSAYDASFAQGLLEAALQVACGEPRVLLVGYDSAATGPLSAVSTSTGLLGWALLLEHAALSPDRDGAVLSLQLRRREDGDEARPGRLASSLSGNAMAPLLGLAEALACARAHCVLVAGPSQMLDIGIQH